MAAPKIFESEYRFCLLLWDHEPVNSTRLVALCKEQLGLEKEILAEQKAGVEAAGGTGRGKKRKCHGHQSHLQRGCPKKPTGRNDGRYL